jgi:hypothetical protein
MICDELVVQLKKKSTKSILDLFQVFFVKNIDKAKKDDSIQKLLDMYSEDIDCAVFRNELRCFLHFVNSEDFISSKSPTALYKLVIDGLSATFPNVETILIFFLILPTSNSTCERSFSTVKSAKKYLRSTISEEHLTSSTILKIESSALQDVNYDKLTDDFVRKKCRRRRINFINIL